MVYKVKYYDSLEEKWNVWSHAIGLLLSIVVFPFLLVKAIFTGDLETIFSFFIYGISMIVLYAASTLYHSAINNKLRYYLNIMDHSAVYILIAGSYAPIALVVLDGKIGWLVFGLSWLVAIMGIVFKIYFIGKYRLVSIMSYVIMGWMLLFFFRTLITSLSREGLIWLLIGGVFYSIGAFFFAADRIKFNHAIFHIFVLLGSLAHFIAVYYHI